MLQAMLETYSGATRVIFIVGAPIAQVQSPAGVTAALRACGRDAVVVPAHVLPEDLTGWVQAVSRMPNCDGIIVTVPHKFAARSLCSSLTPRARSIGAVNAMRRAADGGWHGDMCDGEGYVAGLRQAGCEPRGRRALLVGAGGAGSAIAHALVDAGAAALAIHDADTARRDALIHKLERYGALRPSAGSTDPGDADLAINATPLGMRPHDPLPLQAARLAPGAFVGDVVTVPAVTPLLQAARARGCGTLSGIGMFEAVCQRLTEFYLEGTPGEGEPR